MRFVAIVLVVMSIMVSCKKDSLDENSMCFTRTATHLKIENNTDKVFYMASFGQRILALIDWGPTCTTNNNIQPNSSVSLELSAITGYSDNDKLVVYWWECTNGRIQQVRSGILDGNQAACW